MFEIFGRMCKFLDDKLIYNRPFGFRNNYPTEHALISLTENVNNLLNSGHVVCGMFIYLEQVFDLVKHNGFRGKIEVLIKSYLSNIKQLVTINGFDLWSSSRFKPWASIISHITILDYLSVK